MRRALESHVAAGLAGRALPALLGLLAVPLYLGFLGVEAYALAGAFAALQALLTILDMGLGATLTRQLARMRAADGAAAAAARNLVRSFEVPYWGVALVLAALAAVAGGAIGRWWLRPDEVPAETVAAACVLMGLTAAAQFPFALYAGGLLGLERQLRLNAITVGVATLRVGGTLLVLGLVAPTIEAFFLCQLAASLLQSAAGAVALWTALPSDASRPRFDAALLRSNLGFAAGVAAITIAGAVLSQTDKAVLTRLVALRDFGYYGVAASVAALVSMAAHAVYAAAYPRLSGLVAEGAGAAEARAYHGSSQTLAVLVLPPALVLGAFSREALLAWTGKPDVAEHASLPLTLLLAGSALNGLMHLPYALMLAHGWTRLPLVTNVVAIVILVPALVLGTLRWGTAGAAAAWVALNAGYVIVSVRILHTRHLRGEAMRWYVGDSLLPLAGAAAGAALGHLVLPAAASRSLELARLAGIGVVSLAGAAALAGHVRERLLAKLRRGT